MIKAIIFDCFGVLITDALTNVIEDLRIIDSAKAEQINSLVMASNRGQIDPDTYRQAVADILGLTLDEHMGRLKNAEVKNQELLDYILVLKDSYKIGLLSNVSSNGLKLRFQPEELIEHFDVVVPSSEIGYAKPEAEAYEIIADRLGVRLSDCIMVDDREDYCLGATNVGMTAIQYKSLEQLKADLKGAISLN
jgi:putative hydrolase of the HAD superfamily